MCNVVYCFLGNDFVWMFVDDPLTLLFVFFPSLLPYLPIYSVREQQMKLRDNALQQAEQLLEYKRVLCQSDGFFSVLVSLLAEPLAKTRRTEEEHLCIEIVLHLLRNVLQAQPLMRHEDSHATTTYHHQLIALLERELVLDVVCVLCADLEQPGSPNAAYNLLLMEVLQHLVLPYKLQHVVAASKAAKRNDGKSTNEDGGKSKHDGGKSSNLAVAGAGSLRGSLLRERQTALSMASARHGNFGGSLVLGDATTTDAKKGTNWTVSTTQYAATALGRTAITAGGTTQGNKRVAVFVGALPSRHGSQTAPTPAARTACAALARFCHRFLSDCFAPWAKSLKNEFRRDSVRLEDGDRVVWLQLVAYWSEYWRATKPTKAHSSIGPLLFTMDVFSFHLVHNAADTFTQHKEYGKLAHAVSLLKEMMILLQTLYDSADETEQIMAMGLLDRLFYGSEPLDRLPKLLSQWQPGHASHQYAADLAELVHTQIKMLERHAQVCADLVDDTGKRKKAKKNNIETAHTDTITKMKMAAADFDVMGYIRKLATAHNVYLYTQLLAQYDVNGTRLNHRIVTFLLRVSQFKIVVPEQSNQDDDEVPRNPIVNTTKVVTLEPMLYNVRLLWVLHSILNDVAAARDKSLETVVQFAVRIVNRFAAAAADNPMLLVEALVKHATPHRYCEALANHYVTEELVMMAERDILLEEQEKWQAEEYDQENEDEEDTSDAPRPLFRRPRIAVDSDDEGEVEFDGGAVEAVTTPEKSKTNRKSKKKKRKAILEDSDEEDEDDENENENENEKSETEPPAEGVSKPASGNTFMDESDSEGEDVTEKAEQGRATDVPHISSPGDKQRHAFADDSDDDLAQSDTADKEKLSPSGKKRKSFMDDTDDEEPDGVVAKPDKETADSDKAGSPSKKHRAAGMDDDSESETERESSNEPNDEAAEERGNGEEHETDVQNDDSDQKETFDAMDVEDKHVAGSTKSKDNQEAEMIDDPSVDIAADVDIATLVDKSTDVASAEFMPPLKTQGTLSNEGVDSLVDSDAE